MTKHIAFADEIARGVESGEPVQMLCGFKKVIRAEDLPPKGEPCRNCSRSKRAPSGPLADRTYEEVWKAAQRNVYTYTITTNGWRVR